MAGLTESAVDKVYSGAAGIDVPCAPGRESMPLSGAIGASDTVDALRGIDEAAYPRPRRCNCSICRPRLGVLRGRLEIVQKQAGAARNATAQLDSQAEILAQQVQIMERNPAYDDLLEFNDLSYKLRA